jgi:predicted peptidase
MTMACSPATPYDPVQPGIYQKTLQPRNRLYTIFVPEGYTGKKAVPLILALHYAGHGAPYYGKYILTDMIGPALEELGAIIVSPDCNAADWTQPESEQDILDLIEHLQEVYNIDWDRVLLTGYSMGGMGVWHLASKYPDKFTAAVVMSGTPPANALGIQWQVPLYIIHGRQDEVLPIGDTMTVVEELQSNGLDIKMRILEDTTHYNTYHFISALRDAIPWLKRIWEK